VIISGAHKSDENIPTARMHFEAFYAGSHLFVFGGISPTCLSYNLIEPEILQIHTLYLDADLIQFLDGEHSHNEQFKQKLKLFSQWKRIRTKNSSEILDKSVEIMDAEVIRAKQKIEDEKNRGLSLGLNDNFCAFKCF
jgi:hypothetical protein